MDQDHQNLLSVFHIEAHDILDHLAENIERLVELDETKLGRAVDRAMRNAHNIKGASSVVGREDIESLAHSLEDALGAVKKSSRPPNEEVVDAMLDGVLLMQRCVDDGQGVNEVEAMVARLSAVGERMAESTRADSAQPEPEPSRGRKRDIPENRHPVQKESSTSQGGKPARRQSDSHRKTVRVETDRLERLMGFTGELLVVNGRQAVRTAQLELFAERVQGFFRENSQTLREGAADTIFEDLNTIVASMRAETRSFSNLVDDLNVAMKSIQMVPIRSQVPAWRRSVRESARNLGKRVLVEFDIGDVEIDRSILDRLKEPMTHLLRNAVDHGIESSEDRRSAGKPETGTIVIQAQTQGSSIRLGVSDDGRGINRDSLESAAGSGGPYSQDAVSEMAETEILELIFESGFSSAERVSRISGRGVGLDSVRQAVAEIGGRTEVLAHGPLGGAVFTVFLPVSLLSRRGLLVRVGSELFALPIESVERSLKLRTSDMVRFEGLPAFKPADGGPILVRGLGELLDSGKKPRPGSLTIVVIKQSGVRLGLAVDEVLREEEFVVRKLPWNFKNVNGAVGGVILGDGSLAVAVDPVFLFSRASSSRKTDADESSQSGSHRARILVVDDSMTARTLESGVLTKAGHDVDTAVDGEEAWRMLSTHQYDLLITDVEMPRVDGFELTTRVRQSPGMKDLPVILVTRRGEKADIARGIEVGANEYIVKGTYEHDGLVDAVSRLI